MTDLRIGSLCSGYGGLDMAVMEVLGGSVAWHCQYEPPDKDGKDDKHQYAARILAHHWPAVPNHGDLSRVDWSRVEPVDVLAAGFPCTDISYAGLGAGIKEGTRSGLWLTIADAIGALRPRLVVLENVRAIVNRRPGLDVVLADLARLGFDAEWLCLRASDVGAAHERWRWFCLAWPANTTGPRREGANPERGWTAGDGGSAAADAADLGHEWGWPARRRRNGSPDRGHPTADPGCNGRERGKECHRGTSEPELESSLGEDTERRFLDWRQYGPAVARWERALGRSAPRPTEPGRTGERLSPAFVEFLMGLPAGHVCDVPAPGMTPAGLRNARLKALGNGVVPQQAAHALRLLLARAGSEVAA